MPRLSSVSDSPEITVSWEQSPLQAANSLSRDEEKERFFEETIGALSAVARVVNTADDPEIIVSKVAEALNPYLPVDCLMLSSIEGDQLRVIACSDPTRSPEDLDLKTQPGHVLWPVLRGGISFDRPLIGAMNWRDCGLSFINVPLAIEEQVYGVLHLDSYCGHEWSEAEIYLSARLGEQFSALWQGVLSLNRARAREGELRVVASSRAGETSRPRARRRTRAGAGVT